MDVQVNITGLAGTAIAVNLRHRHTEYLYIWFSYVKGYPLLNSGLAAGMLVDISVNHHQAAAEFLGQQCTDHAVETALIVLRSWFCPIASTHRLNLAFGTRSGAFKAPSWYCTCR